MSVKTSISWADITINPITGCLNDCSYCYARRFAQRLAGRFGYPKDEPYRPTFHPDKLEKVLNLKGKGKRIFLNSMGEWGGPRVKQEWVKAALDAAYQKPEHTFMVLTKMPDRIGWMEDLIPFNVWMGVSVTCQADVWRIQRLKSELRRDKLFVSFEPLHGPIEANLSGIDWCIIGAETGNRKGKIVPERAWVDALIDQADQEQIPIFLKDNLQSIAPKITAAQLWLAGKQPKLRQQFPEGV